MPPRFSPPGRLTDLTADADLQAWSDVVDGALDSAIASLVASVGAENAQLVNPLTRPIDDPRRRIIPWFTFAEDVWDFRRRTEARVHADDPANRRPASRGQNEYSEWFTHRDASGRVTAVDITTELPDYWNFLAGRLSRAAFTAIYRAWANPAATEADLFSGPGGLYNPLNPFNTTRGTMHMINNINNLPAALGLIWDATMWRFRGTAVVDVQDCGLGGPHHADPTVIAHFNRLAREGRFITLQDPVGIYILGVDTDGWKTPDASPPETLVRYVRGNPPVRARVAPPAGAAWTLSEVTIGGEPIRWGSQIAERTTVAVIASVGRPGEVRPTRGTECTGGISDAGASDAVAEDVVVHTFGRKE
jgi:hypothetical protein